MCQNRKKKAVYITSDITVFFIPLNIANVMLFFFKALYETQYFLIKITVFISPWERVCPQTVAKGHSG